MSEYEYAAVELRLTKEMITQACSEDWARIVKANEGHDSPEYIIEAHRRAHRAGFLAGVLWHHELHNEMITDLTQRIVTATEQEGTA